MEKKVKKLTLSKETVRHLTDEELKGGAGGNPTNHGNTCASTCSGNTCDPTCGIGCQGDTCDMCDTSGVCQQTCGGSTCSGPGCP